MTTPALSLNDMRLLLLEDERRARLEERVLALIGTDDDKKKSANFPEGVISDGLAVPLSVLNNRMCQLAAFATFDNAERARWVRENVAHVGCVLITAEEARARYGCNAELVRLDA